MVDDIHLRIENVRAVPGEDEKGERVQNQNRGAAGGGFSEEEVADQNPSDRAQRNLHQREEQHHRAKVQSGGEHRQEQRDIGNPKVGDSLPPSGYGKLALRPVGKHQPRAESVKLKNVAQLQSPRRRGPQRRQPRGDQRQTPRRQSRAPTPTPPTAPTTSAPSGGNIGGGRRRSGMV